jgi:hypothetical protein
MPINLSVIGAVEPDMPGVGAHIRTDHPLNHLLHPDTAPGPYGIAVDVTFQGLAGAGPGLAPVGEGVSGIAPAFLHLGFADGDLDPGATGTLIGPLGIDVQGTGVNFPHLGIASASDSTVVRLVNLLDKQS